MKKSLMMLMSTLSVVTMLSSCSSKSISVGLVALGDESETYSLAHIEGYQTAARSIYSGDEAEDIAKNIKRKVSDSDAEQTRTALKDLIGNGATLAFTNSYGHQNAAYDIAKANPDVTIVADTGDYAALVGLDNFKNAFNKIYESRYVSGYVGGLKLGELVTTNKLTAENYDNGDVATGNIKIGYVGAFPFAEVKSGYTAFYLGVKAGLKASIDKENVVMDVNYTQSWSDADKEGQLATTLISSGCVLIGQHADTTGAPSACETANKNGKVVYSVGYNQDMVNAAPNAALVSALNHWNVYYSYALGLAKQGKAKEIATNWSAGYDKDAVGISTLTKNVAAGTKEKVDAIEKQLKEGKLHVFDLSKFKLKDGTEVSHDYQFDTTIMDYTTNTVVHQGAKHNVIKQDGDTWYFNESDSEVRAAPYFSLDIEGINSNESSSK